MSPDSIPRRNFLHAGGMALLGAAFLPRMIAAPVTAEKNFFSAMGIAASLDKAAALKEAGAQFLTESVGNFLVPDQPDDVFQKNRARLAASPLPILACNGFLRPALLRCVGPDARPDLILPWAENAFRRMKLAGGKFIVFGSGSSRQLPEGWAREKADEQFVSLLKQLGPLAEASDITLVVEQLRAEECNYINHIAQGAALIRAANHPHVRMLADLYHIACMCDSPADLKAAMDVVVHVEIAEKQSRTLPGVTGDDFRPYFHVLRESGYRGAVSIEGKSTDEQIAPAFLEIAKQAREA